MKYPNPASNSAALFQQAQKVLTEGTMEQQTAEVLLTAQQVAEVLAVKASTIYDAAYRGVLPVVRLWEGRRRALIRFRRGDIEEFIRQRSIAPKTQGATERRTT